MAAQVFPPLHGSLDMKVLGRNASFLVGTVAILLFLNPALFALTFFLLSFTILSGLRQRTMILITHRTYLANDADLVLQVEGGKVVAIEPCSKLQ